MNRNNYLIAAAVGSLLSLGIAQQASAADDAGAKEKCFGIAKAGKNDCAASAHSCAGQSKQDASAKEWLYVPKGTCERIAGGSLGAAMAMKKDEMKKDEMMKK